MPIAALPAVALALMALLLIYGLEAVGKTLASALDQVIHPVPILNRIPGLIRDGVAVLGISAQWVVGDVVRPVVNFILAPIFAFLDFTQSVITSVGELASYITYLVDYVPAAILNRAIGYAQHIYNLAAAYAHSLYEQAVGEAEHLYNVAWAHWVAADAVVLHTAEHLYNLAISYANSALRDALGQASNVLRLIDGKIAAETTAIVGYVNTVGADVLKAGETFATQAATAAVGTLVTDVDNILAPVATGLIDDVGSLVGVLATDFPDVGQLVRSIDLTKVGELSGALVGTMTMVRALTRLAEDCTVPNCRNLSQYGRELKSLLNMVEDAAFLAFIVALIEDPQGAATFVIDTFGPVVDGTTTLVREMAGI